ncbi:hypothetical protein GOP47_0013690 [Adiantum capillus-veneris]|uniref:Uncharacterized protein n=1 Tax=Adiantum capillus-veneris TaxID=13818 RepID=A0A9D4ZDM5_ADICA|nr:hypothetical protein GOP47_0013690 [Adiantum capillus-veneris]
MQQPSPSISIRGRQTAVEIAVNHADFLMMAYYLVELRPFVEELNKQQEYLSEIHALPSLQRFTNVIESMHTFTKFLMSSRDFHLAWHVKFTHGLNLYHSNQILATTG